MRAMTLSYHFVFQVEFSRGSHPGRVCCAGYLFRNQHKWKGKGADWAESDVEGHGRLDKSLLTPMHKFSRADMTH